MTARVSVSAVIKFIGLENFMNCARGVCNVSKEEVSFLIGYVHNFAYMVFIRDYAPAGFRLFLEKYKLTDLLIADFYSEFRKRFAADAVTAITVFHNCSPLI